MDFDLRWPILLVTNLVLLVLLNWVNDSLATWGIMLYLPALFLLLPAICLRLPGLFLLIGLLALMIDARTPAPFGFSLILFAGVSSVLYAYRLELRRASLWQWLWVLLATNLFMITVTTLWLGRGWLGEGAYWMRCLTDSLLSGVILFPVGWWFLRLQLSALRLARLGLEPARDE